MTNNQNTTHKTRFSNMNSH